jgi:hypothetical protein
MAEDDEMDVTGGVESADVMGDEDAMMEGESRGPGLSTPARRRTSTRVGSRTTSRGGSRKKAGTRRRKAGARKSTGRGRKKAGARKRTAARKKR